jgi:hypothetical protein
MTEEGKPKPDKKAPPANFVIPPKKPKLDKAERRALQEKQRAEKASREQRQQQGGGDKKTQGFTDLAPKAESSSFSTTTAPPKSKPTPTAEEIKSEKKVDDKAIDLFSHLPQYQGENEERKCNTYSGKMKPFSQYCVVVSSPKKRTPESSRRRVHIDLASSSD